MKRALAVCQARCLTVCQARCLTVFAVFLLVIGVGSAACTFDDQAAQIAASYADQGEAVNIQPQAKTVLGVDEYWVMELVSLGKIVVMLPIKTPACTISAESTITPALKTHYLANFFATDDTLSDYLQNELTYAQLKKTSLENALNQFEVQEPQIPANASLPELGTFKASLQEAVAADDALRAQILFTQPLLASIVKPSDVNVVNTELSSVFLLQDAFLKAIKAASSSANTFVSEVNNDPEMKANSGLGQALIQIALAVKEDVTARGDSLVQNQNAVTAFFSTLDDKASEYYEKLVDRVNNTEAEKERKATWDSLLNYTSQVNNITEQSESLPPTDREDLDQLKSLLNRSQNKYFDGKYAEARALFPQMNTLSSQLLAKIGTWPPACTGGKEWDGSACSCPAGMTEENEKCVSSSSGGTGFNPLLIGGLLMLIVVVIFFGMRKKKPPISSTQSSDWMSQVWQK